MPTERDDRVALITGANKGIGFETARALGQSGLKVLVGARDADRGQEAVERLAAEGVDARTVALDVLDASSLQASVADVGAAEGRLDILVNNAGIGLTHYLPSSIPIETVREVFDTNFFGAIAAAQAFLPLIKASPAGRVVNVSSVLGSLFHLSDTEWIGHKAHFTAYSMSKAALNAFTVLLSAEVHGTNVKVNSVEPGYTATDLTAGQGLQSPTDAARVVVKYALIDADGPNGGYFDLNGRVAW